MMNFPKDKLSEMLFEAVQSYNLDKIKQLLLEYGADINAKDNIGRTILIQVADDLRSATFLLEHGADVNARDDFGITALMEAARSYSS